jgi:transposase
MNESSDHIFSDVRPNPVVSGAPLIRAMCDEIGLREIVDRNVVWDRERCKLSPGERITVLVVNMLTTQNPLYRVEESFEVSDCELLFGEGILGSDLNDDCLGRGLDRLWEGEAGKIFSMIVANALTRENVDRRFTHFDTTSRTVFGEYREEIPKTEEKTQEAPDGQESPKKRKPVQPKHGHSKDHRPDLKQILFKLFVNREGIPLFGEVRDGNLSDKTANGEMISELCRLFSPEELKKMVYVADSALVTGKNLMAMREREIAFLSRLPETFCASATAKEKAFATDQWIEIGRISERSQSALYRASEQEEKIEGHPYRLVVYHSSQLDRRKEKSFATELTKEQERIVKAASLLGSQSFSCEADAKREAESFLNQFKDAFHHVTASVLPREREIPRPTPGRPKKGEEPQSEMVYVVSARPGERKLEKMKAERQRRSSFTLITTLSKEEVPAAELLREYKEQSTCERRFSFMKDPAFIDGVFLKNRERVEALGYVMLLACLVFSLLERRVRQAGKPLTSAVRGKLKNPTGQEILKHLAGVQVVVTGTNTRKILVPPSKQTAFREILSMAGIGFEAYTRVPEPACRSG